MGRNRAFRATPWLRLFRCSRVKGLSPRYFTLLSFYFFLGLQLNVNRFSVQKDLQRYGLSFSSISNLLVFPLLPWTFKFIFGFISDTFPIYGLHRKPYLIFSLLMAALGSLVLSVVEGGLQLLIGMQFEINFFTAFADVIFDALMIEESRALGHEQKGAIQIHCHLARKIGGAIGKVSGPLIWASIGSPGVYSVQTSFYWASLVLSLVLLDYRRVGPEGEPGPSAVVPSIELNETGNPANLDTPGVYAEANKVGTLKKLYMQMGLVSQSFKHPILSRLLTFNLITSAFPSAGIAMFYFMQDVVKFTPGQQSALNALCEVGSLLGAILYTKFFRTRPIRRTYLVLGSITVCLGLVPLLLTIKAPEPVSPSSHCPADNQTCYLYEDIGLNPFYLALSDDFVGEILEEIKSIPLSIVATIVCSQAVEATVYSMNLALQNLMGAAQGPINGAIMDWLAIDHGKFENLPWFIGLCAFLDTCALFCTPLLPKETIPEISEKLSNTHYLNTLADVFEELEITRKNLLRNSYRPVNAREKEILRKTMETAESEIVL